MSELDDFLSDAPAETAAATETTEAAAVDTVDTTTAEPAEVEQTEQEGATAAPEVTDTPVETQKEDKFVPLAAVLDERDKRQKAQRKLEELEQKLATKEPPAPLPDVLDDQAAFVSGLESKFRNMGLALRTEMSQEFMRMQHDDYDAVESEFTVMASENPQLAQQLAASPNPAKFAYDTVKKAEQLAKMDNVEEYEATLRAEIEAKVREEVKAELTGVKADIDAKAGSLTPSLAGQRAAGGNTPPALVIEDPLETTFNH